MNSNKAISISFVINPISESEQASLVFNSVQIQHLQNLKAQVMQELVDLAIIGSMDAVEFSRQRGRVEGQLIIIENLLETHATSEREVQDKILNSNQ